MPELGIERQLGLKERLAMRIAEIHETTGEDSAILDPSEQLNEEAMYAIYDKRGDQLGLFEEQDEEPMTLSEVEELLRQLKRENPDEFERIASLPKGIRTGRPSDEKGIFSFFSAGRYQQLILIDRNGKVVSRDLSKILKTISCTIEEPPHTLPEGYNSVLMKAKNNFETEVKHRLSQVEHSLSLTHGQRYVLRELRSLYNAARDDDQRLDIEQLESAFRQAKTVAVRRELNRLRRNGVTGDTLIQELKRVYFQHNLKEILTNKTPDTFEDIPRIVYAVRPLSENAATLFIDKAACQKFL